MTFEVGEEQRVQELMLLSGSAVCVQSLKFERLWLACVHLYRQHTRTASQFNSNAKLAFTPQCYCHYHFDPVSISFNLIESNSIAQIGVGLVTDSIALKLIL